MGYTVTILPAAERELDRLTAREQQRIGRALDRLGDNPRPTSCKKLQGESGTWRIRVGAYRVVYEVDDSTKAVFVTRIRHRRDVYR